MTVLKVLMTVFGAVGLAAALAALGYEQATGRPRRWRRWGPALAVSLLALVVGLAVVTVPSGMAGVRVSQLGGTRPGTLYPGLHLVKPVVEGVALYDVRDKVWSAGDGKTRAEGLSVQSKEGLALTLAVSVRYRLEPKRLQHIHSNLPPDLEGEIVGPVVASAFRQTVPNYMVREVFATKREEVRQRAAQAITETLGPDGIVVKDVMLRDVGLPAEYARGLEGLLVRQQQSERMVYDVEIKQKEVRTAELEADADKARQVRAAEAAAQVRVLQAKAEADAMQYTLPLKEKQIQQTRLEAEARKEATLKNAEAAGEAKVIDSKAEVQRSNLLAGADAHRVRVMAAAEGERLKLESDLFRDNPLLIQKIVAEKLSDKMQIMMVPIDGRDFFANNIFRSTPLVPSPASTPERADTTRQAVRPR